MDGVRTQPPEPAITEFEFGFATYGCGILDKRLRVPPAALHLKNKGKAVYSQGCNKEDTREPETVLRQGPTGRLSLIKPEDSLPAPPRLADKCRPRPPCSRAALIGIRTCLDSILRPPPSSSPAAASSLWWGSPAATAPGGGLSLDAGRTNRVIFRVYTRGKQAPLVQSVLRISRWQQQSVQPSGALRDLAGCSLVKPAPLLGARAGRQPSRRAPIPIGPLPLNWNSEMDKSSENPSSLGRWWQIHLEAKPDLN
nr:uncharacterized protein LOC111770613 [Equus caballus]